VLNIQPILQKYNIEYHNLSSGEDNYLKNDLIFIIMIIWYLHVKYLANIKIDSKLHI